MDNITDLRIVVVGAGQAGARVCEGIVSTGRRHKVTLVGDEAHLPYERPALSKEGLLDAAGLPAPRLSTAFYADNGVALKLGRRANSLNLGERSLLLDGGEYLEFDRLVIATGSRVRRLTPHPGWRTQPHYLRTLEDAQRLAGALVAGARIGIIGAGFIGLEVAAAARSKGCEVTVYDREARVLSRVMPAVIGDAVEAFHRLRGVEFSLGTAPRILPTEQGKGFVLESSGRRSCVDELVVGIGVEPDIDLAISAGVVADSGILVDAHGESSVPCIYAAGEVTQHPVRGMPHRVRRESWQVAENQAYAAGRSAAGVATQDESAPWFWSDQGDLNLQMAGWLSAGAAWVMRGDVASGTCCLFEMQGNRVVGMAALNARRDAAVGRRIIESGVEVDREVLADATRPLKAIASAS